MSEHLTITTEDGAFAAYLARPHAALAPSVVVLHEVFGVNADLRQTCDDLAARGFLAVCPDLFWRQEPGVDLDVNSPADWEHGLALYGAFDRAKGVDDIVATLKVARHLDGASGKAGLLGYCLGGLMAFLTAVRAPVDAAVWFHGADTETYLEEAPALTAPFMMHMAGEDEFISAQAQWAIKTALAEFSNVQIFDYLGCHHGFTRHGGAHFDPTAAAVANARTLAFLQAHICRD